MSTPRLETSNRLSLALRRAGGTFLWASAIGFFINLLVLTQPIYMMQVFDRVVTSKSLASLVWLTVIAVAALILYGVFEALRSRLLVRASLWLDQVVSPPVFDRALESSLRGHPYRTEALRDVATVRQFLGGNGAFAILDAPWMPLFLALVFMLHPVLGLISVVGGVLIVLLALMNEKLTHRDLHRANVANVRAMRTAEMATRNAEVIDAMGMNAAVANRWALENVRTCSLQGQASDRSGIIHSASKSLRMILQLAILGAGAYLVLNGELSAGVMIAASIVMGRALAPVEMAIGSWKQASGALDAYRRLNGFLDAPRLRDDALAMPRPAASVSVESVTYHPQGQAEPIVRDVSFQIGPGEAVGVIGPSAAGKSTLARMLIGTLNPTRGVVRLDGADIFRWNRADIGNWVGYLPQDVELFEGTVRDNIARMGEVSAEAIVEAAQIAGAHEMILRLPNGYETEIGEAGARLSGGQRQRIGLARALLNKPVLVVLDEPNANLDADGESALNEAIARLKEAGCAIAIVGHRPSVMVHVDKLIVMRSGRMEMFGPKRAVLEQITKAAVGPVAPRIPRPEAR
ncbi:type I secretion system permease/ATPase [Rhodoplanes roseus]|uniref:Type I secretion system permease/ATPase n=1 Tax=Rhodoplanes roseus TaxID=29409 RepID=A0A327L4J8_9BRAD|nr:type I secretion system permease/ATPase [Rhodoplanes roseus]RAI45336.1 hypothetical protein CH341_04480 [Rhodoplanes roseus]